MTTATQTLTENSGRGLVVFRCDASIEIGTGHVRRCLTLAEELYRTGVRSVFVCRASSGDMRREIVRRGFEVLALPANTAQVHQGGGWLGVSHEIDAQQSIQAITGLDSVPDWLVVDHYGIDAQWERLLKPFVGNVMVIDDLADRSHECQLLLDQNLYDRIETRYEELVPNRCVCLLGPRYALLRDEFRRERAHLRNRTGVLSRILLFFGGVDKANVTVKGVQALAQVQDLGLAADVVIGGENPNVEEIKHAAAVLDRVTVHISTDEMALLMREADLSVGAGGTTTWERAYLGLPSITVVVAENQKAMTDAAARAGACINLGWHEQVTSDMLSAAIRQTKEAPQLMRKMSKQALSLSAPYHQTGATEVARQMLQRVRVSV